ncbi:hypothetical protein B0H16DRAFT_1711915 [Mycena metata]|uniref:Uncharacterized protein n=1 Tax=Mycena metata TaxID=1033252 RepID=A0AAD7K6W6_9AGAR|nr:hypothetical protein B0H16DRAFT_1711915 [Mycena metata]
MSDSNPIYFRCLLSFLKKTCSAGRNTNEVAQLKATLETYTLLLMPSDNVVIAIARSSEWRRTLLDVLDLTFAIANILTPSGKHPLAR